MPKFELDPDCYYYEHTNGNVIRKPELVVDAGGGPRVYFKSPFVKRWWHGQNPPQDIAERLGAET